MPIILGILLLVGAFFGGEAVSKIDFKSLNNIAVATPSPTPYVAPTLEPTPFVTQKPVIKAVNNDPTVSCIVNSNCGGGTKEMKNSDCTKSVCCQLTNGSWILTDKDSCSKAQVNNYPPCTIYYPALGYSKTYNYTSPADCSYWKERANTATQPLILPTFAPFVAPTAAPYQYSQEYLNSVNNFNNTVNATWAPTQFVAPTTHCYASWNDYFAAHPNNSYNNIAQFGSPPCD